MPTHLNLRYHEIESLWPHITAYQKLASQYGITDIFQDAGGKMLQLIIATGLDIVPDRNGPDARDRIGNIYEVKSTDLSKRTTGFSTNHHLTHKTLAKYRQRRWVFAMYDGITLKEAYLVEGKDMEPVFAEWERKLRAQKARDHINNPKISVDFVREVGTVMYMKDVPPPWAFRVPESVTNTDTA